jgi:hypothetical protein
VDLVKRETTAQRHRGQQREGCAKPLGHNHASSALTAMQRPAIPISPAPQECARSGLPCPCELALALKDSTH